MRQKYIETEFRSASLLLIETMNEIISEYMRQQFTLTVRQLYYQLVARAYIENTEKSYKRVTSLVNDARMAGLMDWSAIEDRTRAFISNARWNSGAEILESAANGFHMDMWDNQEFRVFCIVEKEALAGVLETVCREYDIPLLAARGYPSGTVLREFAEDDLIPCLGYQTPVILHFGDHDPSGIDMTRDLKERITLFSGEGNSPILERIALTMDQIDEQRPPPNPAKTTDSRFLDYRKKYGSESWELDALQPRYLVKLVRDNAKSYINLDNWNEKREEISDIKSRIRNAASQFE